MKLTDEQIERAKTVNLPYFLMSQGFELKKVGSEFTLKEHDSLRIFNNENGQRGKWFRFSTNEGGDNIRFVQAFLNKSFVEAVELLNNERYENEWKITKYRTEKREKAEIHIDENSDKQRVFDYLCGVRKLDSELVSQLINEGKIAQETKTGNVVFKIFDENNKLVGAEKVGTSATKKFKSIEKGSAGGYGFEVCTGKGEKALFFESSIDLLSFLRIYREKLNNHRLVSMMGVKPTIVKETMKRYGISPENVYLCADNDKAGDEFSDRLIAEYSQMKRLKTTDFKDWNDVLTKRGRNEKMKLYGNTYWQEATDNRDKTVAIMLEETFRVIKEKLDNSGLNYCAYSDGKNAMVAINSSEVDRFKTISELDDSLCRLQKSSREHIPQDKNVIGNTEYRYIPQKMYVNEDRETILKMAELANRQNIQFSARIYPNGKATMTISKNDEMQINAIRDSVKNMRRPMIAETRQRTQEVIGNKPYRSIQNKHFFISPLTPENYRKTEPLLMKKGVEFSGLIRDNKVMFTVEESESRDFHAKLHEAICENKIRENLINIGLNSNQIAVLNDAVEFAVQKNMLNVIESYISKDYDIPQLAEMNSLLLNYLTANDDDKNNIVSSLINAKKEFDTQLALNDIFAQHDFSDEQKTEISGAFRNGVSQLMLEQLDKSFTPEQIQYFANLATDSENPNQMADLQNFFENKEIPSFAERFATEIETVKKELATHDNLVEIAKSGDMKAFDFHFDEDLMDFVKSMDNEKFRNALMPDGVLDSKLVLENFSTVYAELSDKGVNSTKIEIEEDVTVPDSVSFHFGDKDPEWFTESDLLYNFVQENPNPSFALANAVIEYLDEKQHSERDIPELNAGWYKKTDFTITTNIDGNEFTHVGRFDIGDGKNTGGGSFIDHIREFAIGALNSDLPLYNSDDDVESLNYLLDSVVPFLESNSQLSAEEQQIFNKFRAENPIRTEADIEKNDDFYRIYQIKDGEEYHYSRFENLESNKLHNIQLNIDDYNLVYDDKIADISGDTIEQKLENIFADFNSQHHENFYGHSLSVSDVVVIGNEENQTAYYCNDIGFTEFSEFFQEKQIEIESPVVAEFRAKTEELFNSIDGNSPVDIENAVKDFVSAAFQENGVTAEIGSAVVSGSRCRGLENADSDIDVVIEVDSNLKEDALFNIIHENPLEIGGVTVDINPVKKDETGTLETYLPAVEQYLVEKSAEKVKEKPNAKYTYDVYIYDSESGTNQPMRCEADSLHEAKEIGNAYIQQWNLQDAEITDVVEIQPEKEIEIDKNTVEDKPLFSDDSVLENAGLDRVEDTAFQAFEDTNQRFEQLSIFGDSEPITLEKHPKEPYSEGLFVGNVNRFTALHDEIMRGSGFENGKFRIEKFYTEKKPTNKDFADFLKDEYGTGGHSGNDEISFVDHDSKGIHFTLETGEKFKFTWSEVAKMTSEIIDKGEYLTEDNIAKQPKKLSAADLQNTLETLPENSVSQQKAGNFTITDDNLSEGGAKTKFKNNLLSIQTLKQIENENRPATPEEQEFLSKYVGWGGLAQAFDKNNEQWANEFSQLKEIFTPEEYSTARESVLDSFFTSPAIIDGIYEALEKFGFEGGNVLEPSCGVGNFIGKMPSEMAENSNVYGVEIDSISGRIAQKLYPDADIQIKGYEDTHFQNGAFDVAVGNVPFGDLGFPDKKYGTTKLHDYFFAQSLDKVKDGGIVAFVTSKGTLDKKDETFRKQLAEKADLIGAVRLPNNAFKANAGTEVTSDIIFLQKRSEPPQEIPDWVHLGKTEDGLTVNSYFAENPDMVLGKIVEGNKLYGRLDDTMCVPIEGTNLREQLSQAVQKLDAHISDTKTVEVFKFSDKQVNLTADELRPFSFFKDDKGDIYFKGGEDKRGNYDVSKQMDSKNKDYSRISAFIELRDTTRELLKVQSDDRPESEIKAVQSKLSMQYDDFYKKFGLLHSRKNKSVLHDDCSYNLLLTLEKEYDKDRLIAKSDIFTKRTISPSKPIEHVDTALEALAISMAETAKVDLDYMHNLTDMSIEMLISELKGEIFAVPNTDEYQSASEYLSGDIRQKLDVAIESAKTDDRFSENVTALEKALPEPLKAGDIDVKIGATWIPKELYQQFLYETLQTPRENRADCSSRMFWKKPTHITVDYSEHTNTWRIENKKADISVASTRDFGTKKMNAYEIMEHLLNLKDPKVYRTETYSDMTTGEEKERRVVDIQATKIVQQKANKMKQAFKDWIFKEPERAIPLVEQYNRQFNSVRPREYDGSALRFPNMNSEITLKEHQENAIAHALFGGNTLFAHCVGAGKTFEMIATAMESKRLGLCTKPLFAVPNHLTEQIGEDFQKLYPASNILVATKNDFKKENRQQLFAKIATGNFDAVIIGHSQLGMIPLSKERQQGILQEQIDDIIAGIEELKKSEGSRFQVKQMERTKKSLEAKLDKLEKSHDDIITFEEMGIDKLIIDEAHEFKNVPTPTKLTNVAGISSSASQKALDLFMKCRYLDEKTDNKGVIMATGTPLSNSVIELHTMMRFLEYDFLKDHGLANFDNWVTVFGNQKTEWELAPAGNKFKECTRISDYTGLPELMSMFKQVADVRTADTLDLDTPEIAYHIENIEATDFQKELVQELSDRADDVQGGAVEPSVDNMLRITSDGRKLGLDPRLIDPSFEDNPDTKLNQCVKNVTQIYHDTAENRLTQIIFCDLGVPKKSSQSTDKENEEKSSAERESLEEECDFCVYDDIRDKLIKNGVKPEEIAYIHDAKTEQQKTDLFDKVNKGEIRVLLGSTGKMGTGTNCQKKLVALHNLDIPWRPSDLQQRIGRIERQGNQNDKAHVFNYVTKGSFDAYLYQTLEAKQRFIGQIMTSKTPARKCEDVDQQALSYSEIKALCTGDERIKEKMMLENEVKELNLLKSEHSNTVFDMQKTVTQTPEKIEKAETKLENLKADREILRDLPIDAETKLPEFKITIDGTEYTDRKEASKALEDVVLDFVKKSSDNEKEIGDFQGFKLSVKAVMMGSEPDISITMKGNAEHKCVLTSSFSANIKRMESTLYKIDQRINDTQSDINKLKMDLDNAKKIVDAPFPQQAELETKNERLATLTDELNQAAIEAKKNASSKERTCYFERAKLKKEAFKDRQKSEKPKEKSLKKAENLE